MKILDLTQLIKNDVIFESQQPFNILFGKTSNTYIITNIVAKPCLNCIRKRISSSGYFESENYLPINGYDISILPSLLLKTDVNKSFLYEVNILDRESLITHKILSIPGCLTCRNE